jgi:hypothetical protein
MIFTKSMYKNVESTLIENNNLAIQILPKTGAKIASIYSKKHDYEFLVQAPGKKYRKQGYDGTYVLGECSGFDDMFPTIDRCYYGDFPWEGTPLPDHGEVWSLEWDEIVRENELYLTVHGVRLPYRLEKRITFPDDDTLRIEYRLVNLSSFPLSFLWAAHIMINIEEPTRLLLPDSVRKGVTVFSKSGRIGGYGGEFDWPAGRPGVSPAGTQLDISRSDAVEDMEKYYLKDKLKDGKCLLKYPDGKRFELSFSAETVPYLGILMNENGWNNDGEWDSLYNIFLEPCTASFDRIDAAKLRNQCSIVPGKSEYCWYISIKV